MRLVSYSEGIFEAHQYLLEKYPNVFFIGQGLWSPWYVGNTMRDLDKRWGQDRIMDTPVSEDATTAIAAGASLCGYRPVVVHPRVDFMVLAANSIVNQISKWRHMLGGNSSIPVTVRAIINRGGEQGAQHSQSLHSWFSHIPGLRVVMPATPGDARDLFIASVLCDDPVLFMDDRWCYEQKDYLGEIRELNLSEVRPQVLRAGKDITLVGCGFSSVLNTQAADQLASEGLGAEVIDLRVLNPLDTDRVSRSVARTGRLLAIDGSWKNCGLAGEIIARVCESISPQCLKCPPRRLTLPDAPAPSSSALEKIYYPSVPRLVAIATEMCLQPPTDAPHPKPRETRDPLTMLSQ